jgi:hypothetical protein
VLNPFAGARMPMRKTHRSNLRPFKMTLLITISRYTACFSFPASREKIARTNVSGQIIS